MKRLCSNPSSQPVRKPGPPQGIPETVKNLSFNMLPLETFEHICTFFMGPQDTGPKDTSLQNTGPQDTCSALQTQASFYYPVRKNEAFWQRFFERYYYSPSPKQPGQSWLEACKEQNQMIFNVAAGRFTRKTTLLDAEATRFTRDDQGRFVIAYLDGSVKVFDPKTKKSVTLEEPNGTPLYKMAYEGGLCVLEWEKKIRVWELTTPPKKICDLEFKENVNTEIQLIGGRLLIQETLNTHLNLASPQVEFPCTFRVFDLKSVKEKFVQGLKFPPFKATLFNDKLFIIYKNNFNNSGKDRILIQVLNLQTKECERLVPLELSQPFPRFSPSLEMCYSPERGLLCFSPDQTIYQFDLQNSLNSKKIHLWNDPGIPDGFCCLEENSRLILPLPIKELSFLFHKCLFLQFIHWGEIDDRAGIRNFLPGVRLEPDANLGTFHQGKLFCFSKDKKEIHCLDFTDSREGVLRGIVKLLEAEDGAPSETKSEPSVDSEDVSSIEDEEDSTPVDYALMFLERMPLPVQEAIWGIYGEIEKGKEVDPNRLKDAILAYLSSTYGK